VLGSGYLGPGESLQLLDALRVSGMYRKDQNSYTLYPGKRLPDFLHKNIIEREAILQSPFLAAQLKSG